MFSSWTIQSIILHKQKRLMDPSEKIEPIFITSENSLNKRPKTSYIARNKHSLQQVLINPQMDALQKLKMYKQQVKKLQNQYVSQLTQINQSKKVIDKQFRNSQKKKVLFLNLYENRKLKQFQQKLLEEKDEKDRNYLDSVKARAKTTKLNRQIRSLLIKNQIEENNSSICNKNKADKSIIKQKLSYNKTKYAEMARSSFSRIKNSEFDLNVKKMRITEMQTTMSKQNYFKKLGQELKFIQNYDKLLCNVYEETNICNKCTTDKRSTTDAFITDK